MTEKKLAKEIGQRIRRSRQKHGMTAEKLAYENALSKGYLSDIENGKRLPSLKLLLKLSKALDMNLKDFF